MVSEEVQVLRKTNEVEFSICAVDFLVGQLNMTYSDWPASFITADVEISFSSEVLRTPGICKYLTCTQALGWWELYASRFPVLLLFRCSEYAEITRNRKCNGDVSMFGYRLEMSGRTL